jgi:hypothetical protein
MARYRLTDAQRLNKHFYRGVDEAFLFSKALTLMEVAEQHEKFLEERSEDPAVSSLKPKKFREALLAEVHFSEFVQFEALLALLMAIYQDLPHWLFLTTYKTSQMKQWAAKLQQAEIVDLTGGAAQTLEQFYDESVYTGYVGTKNDLDTPWSLNIDNIHWLLKNMAGRYLDAADFNAYKHGLRVHTGHTALMITSDTGGRGISLESDNSLAYLELKPEPDGSKRVFLATKHFNPLEALNNLYIMRLMIETIKATRLARLNGDSGAELNTFFELNKADFADLRERTKWSFSM